jgi:hypothetical protein
MATPEWWSFNGHLVPREPCVPAAVDPANNFSGLNDMPADDNKRQYRWDMLFASTLVAAGVAISALSLNQLMANHPQEVAQATPPLQSAPDAKDKPPAPSEPATTGTRPSNVPPEPARPDPEAQKAGAQPALPPAPAEKTAPPIREK